MVEESAPDQLSAILRAASDPTRRSILTILAQEGPQKVTDLARSYDMSLNAVSKHIKVLEAAELVRRRTIGRVHLIEFAPEPLAAADRWFRNLRSVWEIRLERLDTLMQKEDPMTELTLTARRLIRAPAARLFAAWLDPALLARFMITAENITIPEAEADPRVGGRFHLLMRRAGRDLPHGGTYLEITPPTRLVFTWESDFAPEGGTVTLDFREAGDATELTLTHTKFLSEESLEGHRMGWTAILARLDALFTSTEAPS
ncbi:MAG TPA: metalloregulator ArsR/SmtB family transcription factor [Paracoccaceae bacterium]|nr:metalloregulator ArsR/SmtB family transcription factor [Paracoccaceae bacterium]